MYDSILVPTDGSEGAEVAARHGVNLATVFDSEIHLLSVVDESLYSSDLADVHPAARKHRETLEERATEAVRALEDLVAETAVTCHRAVEHGLPYEVIRDYAEDHDIDLISMGTHGRTGFDRLFVGSVTERVIRTSDVPVLTSRATEADRTVDEYDELLVPTDGSESAAAAVDHGLAIAQRTGARVHAVNVVDVGDAAMSPDYTPPTELIDRLESEGETATESIATRAREQGLDAVTAVREGFPAKDLLAYTDENDIDLIAMGTAGRTGLSRYLMGSTTERMIRHAEVPVLAVNTRNGPGR